MTVPARPRFAGRPGCVRLSAWICSEVAGLPGLLRHWEKTIFGARSQRNYGACRCSSSDSALPTHSIFLALLSYLAHDSVATGMHRRDKVVHEAMRSEGKDGRDRDPRVPGMAVLVRRRAGALRFFPGDCALQGTAQGRRSYPRSRPWRNSTLRSRRGRPFCKRAVFAYRCRAYRLTGDGSRSRQQVNMTRIRSTFNRSL